jgi:hypothetical protein
VWNVQLLARLAMLCASHTFSRGLAKAEVVLAKLLRTFWN